MGSNSKVKVERILVLEDDRGLIDLISETLSLEGYSVDGAERIKEARKLLEKHEYAVFLCDMMIGEESSTDMLEDVLPGLSEKTHVVLLSGKGQLPASARELGVRYYLAKPTSIDAVVALVHHLSADGGLTATEEEREFFSVPTGIRCPHLGLRDDADTWFAFATEENYCHKPASPRAIVTSYQFDVCLSDGHVNCPLFQREGEWRGALPQEMAAESGLKALYKRLQRGEFLAEISRALSRSPFLSRNWKLVVVVGTVAIVALIGFMLSMPQGDSLTGQPEESGSDEAAAVVETPTSLPAVTPVQTEVPAEDAAVAAASELLPVIGIPLAEELAVQVVEISGLAWHGDSLILLPQYPDEVGEQLYALDKADILAVLDGEADTPLVPRPVSFPTFGLAEQIEGFEGFEAIAISGGQVFVVIEASTEAGVVSHVIAGTITPDGSQIALDTENLVQVVAQSSIPNAGDETLVATGDGVLSIYEVNNLLATPSPVAHVFDLTLGGRGTIPIPNLEWRITDATAIDSEGRFWGMITSFSILAAEQLVEMQYSEDGITLTNRAPLQLELADVARNWEGVVRLDDRGFLLVTDRDPETMLAFVAYPDSLTERE